jgi:transcriptional regulator with XRE-family HTH domain
MIEAMSKVKTIHDVRYKSFISELSSERIRLGVSQDELAAQVGLNQSDISKIEKLERRLDILELSMILQVLRIDKNEHLKYLIKNFIGIN